MSEIHDEKCSAVNFLAGLGVGALIGAAVAILLTPKTGNETREELKTLSDDFVAKAGKVTKDLTESSQELLKKSKELVETTKVKVHEAVEAGKQAMAEKKTEMDEQSEEVES